MMWQFSLFGEKLTSPSGILQLMEDLGKALDTDETVFMLGGGNPAKIPAILEIFQKQTRQLVANSEAFLRAFTDYSEPQGHSEFRRALARLFKTRYGWDIGPENIALTAGSQFAFSILFNLLGGPMADGTFRRILLPVLPEYIGYADVGWVPDLFIGMRPTLTEEEGPFYKYHVDFDNLPEDEHIGAVCVSCPTNPTGNVLSREEIEKLARWTRERGIPFIIDNAYGAPFPYILFTDSQPYWDEHVVLIFSLSKLGLPGVRTGIVVAPEPIAQALTRVNALFILAPVNVGAELVLNMARSGELFEIGPRYIRPFYQTKRDQALEWLQEFMGDIPYRVHRPDGAFFLWVWFPELPVSAQSFYQYLKDQKVLVVPGHYFFPGLQAPWEHQHQCVRINYAGSEDVVREGLKRLAQVARKLHEQIPASSS